MTQRFATLLPLAGVMVAYFAMFTCGLRETTASIPGTHVELVGVISSPIVAVSSNGIVAANGDDGRIHFMRANGDEYCRSQPKTDGHFAMNPDGKFVIAAGKDNNLLWIDSETGAETNAAPFVHSSIRSFVLSGDGQKLAIAAIDHDLMSIFLFDATTGKQLYRSEATPAVDKAKTPLAFDPSGRYLVVGGKDVLVRYDTSKWDKPKEVSPVFGGKDLSANSPIDKYVRRVVDSDKLGPDRQLSLIAFSSDGNYLLACSDNVATVLDRRTGKFSPIIEDKLNFVAAGVQQGPSAFWLVTEGGTFKTLDPVTLAYGVEKETSPNPWGTCSAARTGDGRLYVTGVEGGHVTFTVK